MANLLHKNLVYLAENLSEIIPILVRLLQDDIISQHEYDIVISKTTRLERNIELITVLKTRGDAATKRFLDILRITGNSHLANQVISTAELFPFVSNCSNQGETSNRLPPSFQNRNKSYDTSSILDGKWWPQEKTLVKSFFERKIDGHPIIEKLYSMLQDSKTTVITQDSKLVVSGLGGIGKTSLATSFANRYESEYNYVIWIDCGEGSLSKSFQSLARDLKVEHRLELSLTELARKSFAQLQGHKCLIIYDNAECYVGNEGIRDVLPNSHRNNNFHSIITSRNQKWGTETGYGKINSFCMNVFSDDESLQFMKNSLENAENISDSQIARLCELLGYLPLALQISVAALNNHRITISQYTEQIINDNDELLNETFDDYERTINKTMKISLDQLIKETNGEYAHKILMNLGYIQPDSVELTFLRNIERISAIDDRPLLNAITLLEKFSLVTTEIKQKKRDNILFGIVATEEVDCLSIHRLLQQVIRHNGKDIEKEKLRQILSCKGKIDYKIIPYTFAEKHEDLKEEFTYIRTQLIDQVKLADLLKERRFKEAADLALIIHKTFEANIIQNEYLISKYNYGVCLENSGQINNSLKIFKSLVNELKSFAVNCDDWSKEIGNSWKIDENNKIEFYLNKSLSGDLPNRQILKTHIALSDNNKEDLIRCYSHYKTQFKQMTQAQNFKFTQGVVMLHLGLIIWHRNNSLLIQNEFINAVFTSNVYLADFSIWLNFTSMLAKIVVKLIPQNENETNLNVYTLRKLFILSRKFMFQVTNEEFQKNSTRCKTMCNDLKIFVKSNLNENLSILHNIIFNLLFIIKTESGAADLKAKTLLLLHAEDDFTCQTTFNFQSGKLVYKSNLSEIFFARFTEPTLLTSLTLEGITVYMPYLMSSISPCCNLVKICIRKCKFWGVVIHKMKLPSLRHFELNLVHNERKELDLHLIDYFTFFGDCCIWRSIKNLDHYSITTPNSLIKFTKTLQTLTCKSISLSSCYYQLNHFRELDIDNCKFLISSIYDRSCSCSYCVNILDNAALIGANDNAPVTCFSSEDGGGCSSVTKTFLINYTSIEKTGVEKVTINRFLIMYNNLQYLEIVNCRNYCVDIFCLDYIEIIFIGRTRIQVGRSTPANSGGNSQLSRRCKKLTLIDVIPSDHEGNNVASIDFCNLNVKELVWIDYSCGRYFVRINQIPSGVKKICLEGVRWKCGGKLNSTVNLSNTFNNNTPHLRQLTLVGVLSKQFKLDLVTLPHSLKDIKLNNVHLTGEVSPFNPCYLNRLILVNYAEEVFNQDEFKSLQRKVENVVVYVERTMNLQNVVTSFPSNVKNVFGCINYGSECVHYKKIDDNKCWGFKEIITKNIITEEEFDRKINI